MKHDAEALQKADQEVLASGDAFGAIVNLVEAEPFQELVADNVESAAFAARALNKSLEEGLYVILLYGFLWGYKVASNARHDTAARHMGG